MISEQVQCMKRCDQVVITRFKRCDSCSYSGYATRLASLMMSDVDMGMIDYNMEPPGCLSFRSREPVLPSASSWYSLILFLCIPAAARS